MQDGGLVIGVPGLHRRGSTLGVAHEGDARGAVGVVLQPLHSAHLPLYAPPEVDLCTRMPTSHTFRRTLDHAQARAQPPFPWPRTCDTVAGMHSVRCGRNTWKLLQCSSECG